MTYISITGVSLKKLKYPRSISPINIYDKKVILHKIL